VEGIARLRQEGETVVCVLPGHESEIDELTREMDEERGIAATEDIVADTVENNA